MITKFLGYLFETLIFSIFLFSILFVLTVMVTALTSQGSGIPYSALVAVGIFAISMWIAATLEGVQQAANTISTLDEDVVQGLLRDEKTFRSIKRLLEGYEEFSSARQLVSIIAIFSFKEGLAEIAPQSYALLSICGPLGVFPQNCDIGRFLSSGVNQFVAAAAFTAWLLQLVPKRLARLSPIGYLVGTKLVVARCILAIGSFGFGKPTLKTIEVIGGVFPAIPKKKQKYPVSSFGVLDELAKRLGYYAENVELRVQFGELVKVVERVEYRLQYSDESEPQTLNKIVHRTNLNGRWSFEDVTTKPSKDLGWSTEVSTRRIRDFRTRQLKKRKEEITENFELLEADEAGAEDQIDIIDDQTVQRIKAKTGRAFTRIKSEVLLDQPISAGTHKDFSVVIETHLLGSPLAVRQEADAEDSPESSVVSFLVSVPVKNLRVVVSALSIPAEPTGTILKIRDVFRQESDERMDFKPIDPSELVDEETAGQYIDLRLPYLGSEIVLRTSI